MTGSKEDTSNRENQARGRRRERTKNPKLWLSFFYTDDDGSTFKIKDHIISGSFPLAGINGKKREKRRKVGILEEKSVG